MNTKKTILALSTLLLCAMGIVGILVYFYSNGTDNISNSPRTKLDITSGAGDEETTTIPSVDDSGLDKTSGWENYQKALSKTKDVFSKSRVLISGVITDGTGTQLDDVTLTISSSKHPSGYGGMARRMVVDGHFEVEFNGVADWEILFYKPGYEFASLEGVISNYNPEMEVSKTGVIVEMQKLAAGDEYLVTTDVSRHVIVSEKDLSRSIVLHVRKPIMANTASTKSYSTVRFEFKAWVDADLQNGKESLFQWGERSVSRICVELGHGWKEQIESDNKVANDPQLVSIFGLGKSAGVPIVSDDARFSGTLWFDEDIVDHVKGTFMRIHVELKRLKE